MSKVIVSVVTELSSLVAPCRLNTRMSLSYNTGITSTKQLMVVVATLSSTHYLS